MDGDESDVTMEDQPDGDDYPVNDSKAELAVARARLHGLIRHCELWKENQGAHSRKNLAATASTAIQIVGLLDQFPTLASEKIELIYRTSGTSIDFTILALFVLENFHADVLEKVYSLYPQAIFHEQGQSRCLLNLACGESLMTDVDDDTIVWLLSKYNKPLRSHENVDFRDFMSPETPLDNLLTGRNRFGGTVSLRIIKAFWEKDPSVLGTKTVSDLFFFGYNDEILNYAADKFHPGSSNMCFQVPNVFTLPMAKAMRRILPKLNLFRFISRHCQSKAWDHLMVSLRQCSIKTVSLYIDIGWHGLKGAALQGFLQHKPKFTDVDLLIDGDYENMKETMLGKRFECIIEGCARNTSNHWPVVRSITLHSWTCIRCGLIEKLSRYTSHLQLKEQGDLAPASYGLAFFEDIEVTLKEQTHFSSLLSVIHTLPEPAIFDISASFETADQMEPELKTLELNVFYKNIDTRRDITEAIVTAINLKTLRLLRVWNEHNFSLQDLIDDDQMEGEVASGSHKFQVLPLTEALAKNTTLESLLIEGMSFRHCRLGDIPSLFLKALETENTSLVSLWAKGDLNRAYSILDICDLDSNYGLDERHSYVDFRCGEKIRYAMLLNKFGRRKVRQKSTTLPQFVGLLLEANRCDEEMGVVMLVRMLLELQDHEFVEEAFKLLLDSVDDWHKIVQSTERAGVLYGLLRESPDFWSTP